MAAHPPTPLDPETPNSAPYREFGTLSQNAQTADKAVFR